MSYLDSDSVLPDLGQNAASRLRAFLRAKYTRKTAESVSADTGIAASTVAAWLKGISSPSFETYNTLIDAYGVDLLSAVLPRNIAVAEAAQAAERRRLSDDMSALRARMEALR